MFRKSRKSGAKVSDLISALNKFKKQWGDIEIGAAEESSRFNDVETVKIGMPNVGAEVVIEWQGKWIPEWLAQTMLENDWPLGMNWEQFVESEKIPRKTIMIIS